MAKDAEKDAGMSAVTGASTGAAIGTEIMPGWGTAIGAVIGGIAGGVMGAFRGSAKRKAKRYQRLAAQIQQQRENNKDYATFLQMIRQQRLARAATIAESVARGVETSSAARGAVSGQQAQTAYSINYLAEDRRLQELYLGYMRRAGKATSIADDISALWGTVLSTAQPWANRGAKRAGEMFAKSGTQSTSSTTTSLTGDASGAITQTTTTVSSGYYDEQPEPVFGGLY